MQQARLRSSFIYLANAVSDLSGNWATLGLVLAPLVLLASLCFLPDALNLQALVAHTFESGMHAVSAEARPSGALGEQISAIPVQEPYRPETGPPLRPHGLFPGWLTTALHLIFILLMFPVPLPVVLHIGTIIFPVPLVSGAGSVVNVVVLCALARMHSPEKAAGPVAEAIEVYRHALSLLPAILWIAILQVVATAVGFVLLVVPSLLVFVWLFFSQYALVFDGCHSWSALLHSRDLVRGRFFKVAVRIVVFLAVWSGYNSWTLFTFGMVSGLLGPIAAFTGFVWMTMFALVLVTVSVAYITAAFFIAAGLRLYRDLTEIASERAEALVAGHAALQPTAPLSGTGA